MNQTNTPLHIKAPWEIQGPPQIEEPIIDELAQEFEKHIIETVERVGYITATDLRWTYERQDIAKHMRTDEVNKFWSVLYDLRKRERIIRVMRPADPEDYDPTDPYWDEETAYFWSTEHVSKMVFPNG